MTIKKGEVANSYETTLTNKTKMTGLKEDDSYKHLGVIQTDGTKHHEMKENSKQSTIDE